ncbi:MAG TPA: NAD(P)-dependent oxidoreductase [Candidatus Dormibacteraeota bacterium]|nr:NAD(P)-dependent oxidoreductase [Candidatus Dormibacteraeota bacterium]
MNVFYPVSLNLAGRTCVVIGERDDREAIDKAAGLEEAGANVRWLSDLAALRDEDIVDAFFVISTPQDEALSRRLRTLADRHKFLLCCIDQPAYGFVAMAAIAKSGPVRIAISTTGQAPRVGKALKEALQGAMDATFERFIACLSSQKTRIKRKHPDANDTGIRRKAMIDAATGFTAKLAFTYPEWFLERERTQLPAAIEKAERDER